VAPHALTPRSLHPLAAPGRPPRRPLRTLARRPLRPRRPLRTLARCSGSLLVALLPAVAGPALAASVPTPRQALVVVMEGVSFERAMAVPGLRALARAGGVGLMTTKAGTGDPWTAAHVTIGAGTRSPAGGGPVLGEALRRAGVSACLVGGRSSRGTEAAAALLLTSPRGSPPPCRLEAGAGAARAVAVWPVGASARAAGAAVRSGLASLPDEPTLVMVITPTTSPAMDRIGDEVTPLVMAAGRPGDLLRDTGLMGGLTSDTTRWPGLVSNVDVAPTLLGFFGAPVPTSVDGQPVRVAPGAAPFGLHRLHLEQRRIRLPVQMAELAFLVLAAIVASALLVRMGRGHVLSPGTTAAMRFLACCCVAVPIALVAGGLLPSLSPAWVWPFLALVVPDLALAATLAGRRWGPFGPLRLLAGLGLALVVLDLAVGGRALRIPLFGGTMLDGVRYYGVPNGFICLLLGGGLFLASGLSPRAGLLLLAAIGLVEGFPSLGADVGGAITLFAAAGMWWALARPRPAGRRGVGPREAAALVGVALGAAVAVVTAGLAVVLAANRLAGAPTHATRFVLRSHGSPSGLVSTALDRLEIGARMLARVPAAVLPLVGFVVLLVLLARRVGPLRWDPPVDDGRWRAAMMVMMVAALVAYVANDTGAAAADPVFIHAMAGIVVPAMLCADLRRERRRPHEVRAEVGPGR
jgi:hypothetical protein